MERKIGEIFEYNGEWYQCVEDSLDNCINCCFYNGGHKKCSDKMGECFKGRRSDNNGVYFKKLEKVGEPYMLENKKFQKYKVFKTPYIYHKIDCSWQSFADPYYISLEIKEDMEEKKLNLKPFDIQKAREGKPVCTRDGRKARIICFDLSEEYPIVASVYDEDKILLFSYKEDGRINNYDYKFDLMMLPEKKDGWINICRNLNTNKTELDTKDIYNTKEEALQNLSSMTYVTTVKIEWEE